MLRQHAFAFDWKNILNSTYSFLIFCCFFKCFFLDLFQIHGHTRILAQYSSWFLSEGNFQHPRQSYTFFRQSYLPFNVVGFWFGKMAAAWKKTARNDGFQVNILKIFSVKHYNIYHLLRLRKF